MTTPSRAQLPPLPKGIRLLTNMESQNLNARMPWAATNTVANCITCHGSKTFLWKDPSGQPVEYDCPCEDQYLLFRYLLRAGVALNYQRLGWSDFLHLSDDAATAVAEYFTNRERYISAGIGMVFTGTRGNGKTLLSNLVLKQMIGEGVNCYATTFSDMIDSFAGGWQDREQSRWFSRAVRNAGVLYIDDLGRERNRGPESVGENMLETVVRSRVASNQPLLVSTNLSQADILSGYGGHTMSLLTERSIFVEVTGADRREEIRRRSITEVNEGLTRPIVVG